MKKLYIKGYGDDLTIINIRIGDLSPSEHTKIEEKLGGHNYSPLEDAVVSHVKDSSTLICRKPDKYNIYQFVEEEEFFLQHSSLHYKVQLKNLLLD